MVGGKRRSRVILQVRMRGIHPRNPADHHSYLNVHPTLAFGLGHSIREAMINWKDGLGPLMPAIWTVTPGGNIPTLAVDKGPRMVTMIWYQGGKELEPVIEIPRDWGNSLIRNWQGLAPPTKHRHRKHQGMAVGYYPERPIKFTFTTTKDDEVRTKLNGRVSRVRGRICRTFT